MITLDVALHRLLHKRAYRQAFLDDDDAALDVSTDDLRALAAIDRGELCRTADRIAKETLIRTHRGTGTLLDVFPETIAAWDAAHADGSLDEPASAASQQRTRRALAFAFLDSDAFDTYRAFPFAGVGRSLEEAFYVFCEAAEIGEPIIRERELLSALVRALAVTPTAEITLPETVRRVPTGFFAVTTRGAPVLFAAVGARYVTGEITPFLADLLVSSDQPKVVAERHGVGGDTLAASEATLRSLGLR